MDMVYNRYIVWFGIRLGIPFFRFTHPIFQPIHGEAAQNVPALAFFGWPLVPFLPRPQSQILTYASRHFDGPQKRVPYGANGNGQVGKRQTMIKPGWILDDFGVADLKKPTQIAYGIG